MVAKSLGVFGICLLLQPAAADATTLQVFGTCVSDCLNIGVLEGAPIGGTILLDDTFFKPGGFSGSEALTSYSFVFGNLSFGSADQPDPGFSLFWGETPGNVASFFLSGFVSDDPEKPGPAVLLDAFLFGGRSIVSHAGYSRTTDCCLEYGFTDSADVTVDGFGSAPVPLPPAALLLAGGLAGLAGLRLRRRSGGPD